MASDYRMTADNCTLLALQMQCLVTEMFLALAHRLVMSNFKDSIARIGGLLLLLLLPSYHKLGRHQDALVLQEKTLEFWRRMLPENHPEIIGTSCFNNSLSYRQARDFHQAFERAREALRIYPTALPPSHPHVKMAQELVRQLEGKIARRA